MAAYLGHPAAATLELPPPPSVESREYVLTDGGFSEHSLSHALLEKGPISTRDATLFSADCASRILRLYQAEGRDDEERALAQHMIQLGVEVLKTARGWVLGFARGDPSQLADELFSVRPSHRGLNTAQNVLQTCEIVGHIARAQPGNMAGSHGGIVRNVERTIWQSVIGDGLNMRSASVEALEEARQATRAEKAWQDQHLAHALLADQWPMLPLP
jgi:hypothetical protein